MSNQLFRVHLKGDFSRDDINLLKSLVEQDILITSGALPEHGEHSILVGGSFSREEVSGFSNLKSIIIPWAGVPASTLETVRANPQISLHNIHHNSVSASEMAVTLMLAAAKRILPADKALRQNDWTPRYKPEGILIDKAKVLVIGWGAIGKRIGKICIAFGAEVSAISRTASGNSFPPESLHSLLPETDILFLSVPSTPKTIGLIGERELKLLKSSSILVNISRSNVVNEKALYESLKGREIGAAGLDVWYNYPKSESARVNTEPSNYPFNTLSNVVMSPHRGGAFGIEELEIRRIQELAILIQNLYRGEISSGRVNIIEGY